MFSGVTLVAIVLGAYRIFTIDSSNDASLEYGRVVGFQFGIICGIGILSLIQIIILSRAVKDEIKLKKLYNQEHDERLKTIKSRAGMPMLMITSIIMLIAAIIGGYFNIVVFYTLVIASTVQLFLGAIVKIYCMKTM